MRRLSQCVARRCSAQPLPQPFFRSKPSKSQSKFLFSTWKRLLNEEDDTQIRWYEQLFYGAPNRKRIDAKDVDDEEEKDIKARIAKLEQELKELRDGISSSAIDPLLEGLSDEEQEEVKTALAQDTADTLNTPTTDESQTAPEASLRSSMDPRNLNVDHSLAQYLPGQGDLEITVELPPGDLGYLKRLNGCLRQVAMDPSNATLGGNLWRNYERCRRSLQPFLSLVPDGAWAVLWESQYRALPASPKRATRLRTLLEDMLLGGKNLNPLQRFVYIESMYAEGCHNEAIQKWLSEQEDLRDNQETSEKFEELGVRIYASQGDFQTAQDLALSCITNKEVARARILIPVIEAWVHAKSDIAIKHAWALYLQFRMIIGSEIRLDDYDTITMAFLNAGQTAIALAVFKDLMLSGQESCYESRELYKTSLGVVGILQSKSINMAELTEVSMTALTVLPRRFQNKFFYGSWMKKLLGMGEINAAALVVELMYERGVKPDSKHLNGIIGAWLRSGGMQNKTKALQMGWAMIQERVNFVRKRQCTKGKEVLVGVSDLPEPTIDIPSHLQRTISPATIETFSLLLLYYERRGMLKYVEHLKQCLQAAEIQPNAYFMNHMLYAELRRGNHRASWKIYKDMTRHVKPDLETFACLWDCEKAHLDRLAFHPTDDFPNPRLIFCEMITWYSQAGKTVRGRAKQEFSRDLYHQIIRCMCLARDLQGTIVALHALSESFLLYPDQATARMVMLQVSRMGPEEPRSPKSRRSRMSSNSQNKVNVAKVSQIFELLTEQRAEEFAVHDIRPEAFDEERQAKEQLYLLSEFLRLVLRKSASEASAVEKDVEKVAWDLGVSGITMFDSLVSI
ncbi:hypothetical protein MMC06_001166 [Schaereria dolodes]|nr:hypothetical protein [Schaereria dolodes]